MPVRKYVSSVRTEAAALKREKVLNAAARLLRESSSMDMSVDSVARAAGVTRLTIYNQFQSRHGLLEAVFDKIAGAGGLSRIPEAMAAGDPAAALARLVEIFCEFWSHDPAIGRLTEAAGTDPEFAQTLAARNQRRRKAISVLVERAAPKGSPAKLCRDTADLIFALTSYQMFALLSDGRSTASVILLLRTACGRALESLKPDR